MSGSGISWAICKSASRSRQITTPAPHCSVFYRPDALPATQPTASKHWRHLITYYFSLTKQHTTSLENTQRCAWQIIAGNIPYEEACCMFKLTLLYNRWDSLCSKLFRQLVSQSHILRRLLPMNWDDELTGRLQSRNKYPTVHTRINRFKNSFIHYALGQLSLASLLGRLIEYQLWLG